MTGGLCGRMWSTLSQVDVKYITYDALCVCVSKRQKSMKEDVTFLSFLVKCLALDYIDILMVGFT